MSATSFLPLANLALCLGAAVVYAAFADWKHAIYWAACAVIAGAVTSF